MFLFLAVDSVNNDRAFHPYTGRLALLKGENCLSVICGDPRGMRIVLKFLENIRKFG